MLEASDTFWDLYRAQVQRLMRPLRKPKGCSEKRVLAAEQRLGLPLPQLLRQFYLLTGERNDINGVFNRLVPPENMQIYDGVLVFYEENQEACVWGINVHCSHLKDPPVLRFYDAPSSKWEPEFDNLSQFLTAMLYMQAVNGGMRYVGVGRADCAMIAEAALEWENVYLGGGWNHRVLVRDGQALYVFGNEPTPEVFGGARTKEKFLKLEKAFDVSWDYCTLQDE